METNKIIYCRTCLIPTEQKPAGFMHYNIVTCLNSSCKMCGFTFTSDCYSDVRLTTYGATEHPDYARVCGLDMSLQMDTDNDNEVPYVQG